MQIHVNQGGRKVHVAMRLLFCLRTFFRWLEAYLLLVDTSCALSHSVVSMCFQLLKSLSQIDFNLRSHTSVLQCTLLTYMYECNE